MTEFQWDSGNIKHVVHDHPERGNTLEEVESIFSDGHLSVLPNRVDPNQEFRFKAIGVSNQGRVLVVVFVVRNDLIRPISCWPANSQTRKRYYESIG